MEGEGLNNSRDERLLSLVADIVDYEDRRTKAVLENVSNQDLQQGKEYFARDIAKSAQEITSVGSLEKVSLDTVLRGYIGASVSQNAEIKGVYREILQRKGLDNIDVLDAIIDYQIMSGQNVGVESIKKIYYRKSG